MQTIRLVSNISAHGVGNVKKKNGANGGSGVFDVGGGDPSPTINSLLISTALPLESRLTEQDKEAIHNGRICLDDLERWRRQWLQWGGGSVEELKRIQGALNQSKPASPKLQSLMDEVSILLAVEIAKRSR